MDPNNTIKGPREKSKYDTLLELSGSGVFELANNSKKGTISGFLSRLLHLPEDTQQLSIEGFAKYIANDQRLSISTELKKALKNKTPFSREFILNNINVNAKGKSSGETYLLLITPSSANDPSAQNTSGVQKFVDILDFIPIPLIIISDDGNISHINHALTEVTGYTHEDIPTIHHWVKAAYGEDTQNHSEIINQFFQVSKYRSDGEFRFFTKDNKTKYLHFYTAPLGIDENGKRSVLSMAADVTEVRKKDELIRHQADELKVLTDRLPHLIFTSDKNGELDYISDSWLEYTGAKTHEEFSKISEELVHPNDQQKLKKYGEMSVSGAKPFDMDVRIKHHSGIYRWLNIRAVPVLNAKQQVLKWIGTGTDVHDKYTAEQKLLHKASEFISLVELLDHHVWVINADGVPEFFNKAWYNYTGLSKELTWRDRMSVVHPTQKEKIKYQVDLAWKKRKSYEVTMKMRRHDGEYQWFLSKGVPVLDEKGELIKYVGTIVNIHSHRQLEEALKLEVSVLSEIIESIPQMAWTSDSEGNIDFYNKRWYEYTRQSPQDALGWGWKGIFHPEDLEDYMDTLMKALKSEHGYESEARLLKKEENIYLWHLIKATPVKEPSGTIKYWITTATNIHGQKMLEQNKGQFLNIASHELRTPLTTLMGYLQLMEYAIAEKNYSDMEVFLSKTTSSSRRMNKLINDLLNLSSIDSGKIAEFYKEKVNLGDFIADIINNYRYLRPEKEFILNIKATCEVNANAFRLEQVVDNLISNAMKYAPASPIQIEVTCTTKDVRVSVSDKGEGIPEDKLEAIFDRFFRVKDHGTTSGLGVGLFISREIINEHDGEIWAESTGNQGSTFIFTLPKA